MAALYKIAQRFYYKAKIRQDLERGFGLYALAELAIESVGKKPDTRYGIKMDKSKIRIIF